MNKVINVTKTIVCLTTWTNDDTKETVVHNSETNAFYCYNNLEHLQLYFEASRASEYLQLCDEAVSNNCHSLPVANIHNTSFLSMVLTQFLHKAPATHNDETHN